jgi:hypothetical protein
MGGGHFGGGHFGGGFRGGHVGTAHFARGRGGFGYRGWGGLGALGAYGMYNDWPFDDYGADCSRLQRYHTKTGWHRHWVNVCQ